MNVIRQLWQEDKPLVITFAVALVAILYYVYKQNAGKASLGSGGAVDNAANGQTPTIETEQLATILAALGNLTPVTNSSTIIQAPITTTLTPPTITTTLTTPPVTTTITNSASSISQVVMSGIGNDTARDAAIRAAEAKYKGSANAAALHAEINKILAQYPRSGPTI